MADSLMEFEAIYVRYHPKIVRYLARFVGWHEAEDLSQEVFVKVGRSLASFRGESRISTWIYRIATNAALDRLRTPSFQAGGSEGTPGGADRECENGGTWRDDRCRGSEKNSFSVERQFLRKEMNACIRYRIENLPEPYRSVLVLSELAEFANGEIADMTGVSLTTVKIRLHRARARLKKDLEGHCTFYHDETNELACDLK